MIAKKDTRFQGIDQNPSLLGFGCMRLPTLIPGEPAIDVAKAESMIDLAYQRGVNYFDTAYPYHHGMSETFIGNALKKYPRESFYLADKMPSWLIKSPEDAKRIFAEQLQKCQVEYFDFYLCHALSRDAFKPYLIPGVMDFLYQMKAEGKIRHLGFSFHDTPDILETIINTYEWDFVQLQLNYLDWDLQDAKRQYEIVTSKNIPVIVMEPIRGGTLATLSDEATTIFKNANPEASIASWALRYAASKKDVLVVLSGMSNLEQVEDNLHTMSQFKPINESDQSVIDQALDAFLKSRTVPCTACGYCMPCPHGVDIPGNFKIFNGYQISKSEWAFLRDMNHLDESARASACIACGECLSKCPQKIEIPTRLGEIADLFDTLRKAQESR